MYDLSQRKADSAQWLLAVRDQDNKAPEAPLPRDMPTEEMPDDAVRLKKVIDEFQFLFELRQAVSKDETIF